MSILNPLHKPWGYRILEMIPGLLVWITFIFSILISIIHPLWGVYFILAFDLYWLLRILYLLVFMNMSWRRYSTALTIDWWEKLKKETPAYVDYYHAIFLPTLREPFDILDETLSSLQNCKYDPKRFIIILGGEEIDKINFLKKADKLKEKYSGIFHHILTTVHPQGLPGEMAGKGSNSHWMAKNFNQYAKAQQIKDDKIIVSNFDSDTQVHPHYFSYLTYTYLTARDPTRYSYQPVSLFNNNIWESPFLTRIIYNSTTFWLFTDLARPERLFTFSSHSMSWVTLKKVGYWQPDIVTEDSRICLQAMVLYHGNYMVKPMYIPISMDTAYIGSFFRTLVNQYKQQRRWAYGVENFPYIVWHFWSDAKMSFSKKIRHLWNQLEGVYSWSTAPIIIFIMGNLPLAMLPEIEATSVLAQNAPFALRTIMIFAMIGLVFSAGFSSLLMPKRPLHISLWKHAVIVLQWVFFPIAMIIFGSIPATDAQTRLMLGKYLGFNVTQKKRA